LGYFVGIRAIFKEGMVPLAGRAEVMQRWRSKVFAQEGAQKPALHGVRAKAVAHGLRRCPSRLRQWLDRRKLQTTGFKITTDGRVGFDVCFSSERDAAEFQLFDWER
jgi:hypothetical protein